MSTETVAPRVKVTRAGRITPMSTALVVEDDGPCRRAMVGLMRDLGFRATGVANLQEAMARVAAPPDLLVLDLVLPDGDGLTMLRHLRGNRLPTRVAVVTGACERSPLADVQKYSPDAIFGKPLDVGDFVGWVRAAVPLLGAG